MYKIHCKIAFTIYKNNCFEIFYSEGGDWEDPYSDLAYLIKSPGLEELPGKLSFDSGDIAHSSTRHWGSFIFLAHCGFLLQ